MQNSMFKIVQRGDFFLFRWFGQSKFEFEGILCIEFWPMLYNVEKGWVTDMFEMAEPQKRQIVSGAQPIFGRKTASRNAFTKKFSRIRKT